MKFLGDVSREAADWLVRRQGGFSSLEQMEYERWLSSDSRHAEAMADAEASWRFLEKPRRAGQGEAVLHALAKSEQKRIRLRRYRAATLAFAGMAAAALVALWLKPGKRMPESVPARAFAPASPELATLDDGSVVELKAGSQIKVEFTPAIRGVRLLSGEAHFAVAKNPLRPFVVTAGAVAVRAVGTAFAVRLDRERVDVLVTEGRVTVKRPESTEPPAPLEAGHLIMVPTGALVAGAPHIQAVTPDQIAQMLSWRNVSAEFSDTPLADALAQFNRRNRLQLTLADPALAHLRISGLFRTDDPEGFARLLESSAGLRAVRESDGRLELGSR